MEIQYVDSNGKLSYGVNAMSDKHKICMIILIFFISCVDQIQLNLIELYVDA